MTHINGGEKFTLCARVIVTIAGAIWKWSAIFDSHCTNTIAIAVLDTLIKALSIAGYVAVRTVGTRMTDTLITTRGKVVAGAIIRASVCRTGSYDMRVCVRERERERENESECSLYVCDVSCA